MKELNKILEPYFRRLENLIEQSVLYLLNDQSLGQAIPGYFSPTL